MAKRLFYSMGEVSEMFDVKPSLLRHWESKFDILRPHKNKKGNRMFTPEDVENLKLIYHLVKERGMTLNGAAQYLKNGVTDAMRRDMMLLERLQYVRSELAAVRQLLRDEAAADQIFDEEDTPDTMTEDPLTDSYAVPEHNMTKAMTSGNEPSNNDRSPADSCDMAAMEIAATQTTVTEEIDESVADHDYAPDTDAETVGFAEPAIFPEMLDIADTANLPETEPGNMEKATDDPETYTTSTDPMIPPAYPRGSKGAKRTRRQDTKLFEVKPEPQKPIAPYFDQTLF